MKIRYKIKTAYGFNLSDFCVDAEELQITQCTDSSHTNYRDGSIKMSDFIFAESAHVIVCFCLVSDGRYYINFLPSVCYYDTAFCL